MRMKKRNHPGKSPREIPEWEDDGRTIVSMDVDGMPWRSAGKKTQQGADAGRTQTETLTREESRYYTWGALKAALLVVGVMCAGLVLFILFCQFIWFQ